MRGFVIKQEKHLSALKKKKKKKGLCLCAAVADGWTSAGNPEQEVTRWDRDREIGKKLMCRSWATSGPGCLRRVPKPQSKDVVHLGREIS